MTTAQSRSVENNTVEKFELLPIDEKWIDRLQSMYPLPEDNNAPVPLPSTVIYDTKPVGKYFEHIVRETRNLFLINTEEDLNSLCDLISKSFAVVVDTEFYCTDWGNTRLDVFTEEFVLAGICIAVDPYRGFYIPINHTTKDQKTKGQTNLFDNTGEHLIDETLVRDKFAAIDWNNKIVCGHNPKIDIHALLNIKLDIPFNYDTRVDARLLDNRMGAGLKELTTRAFGYEPIELGEVWKGKQRVDKDFRLLDVDFALAYAASDPVNNFRCLLYTPARLELLKEQGARRSDGITNSPLDILQHVELPLIRPLARMERMGIKVNTKKLLSLKDKMQQEITKLSNELDDILGIKGMSYTSTEGKAVAFFDMLRIPVPKNGRSTAEHARLDMLDLVNDCIDQIKKDKRKLDKALDQAAKTGKMEGGVSLFKEICYNLYKQKAVLPWKISVWESEHNINVNLEVPPTFEDIKKLKHFLIEEEERHYRQIAFIDKFGEMSKLTTLKNTFTSSIVMRVEAAVDNLYHTSFNQLLNSGRMSSSPNLQNLPRSDDAKWDVRECLEAIEGYVFVLCDWSSMEMKIAAAISNCSILRGIVTGNAKDAAGNVIDIHGYTAAQTIIKKGETPMDAYMRFISWKTSDPKKHKEKRNAAKRVNFGILYGISAIGLSSQLRCTRAEAQQFIDAFLAAYPGVASWMDSNFPTVKDNGYTTTPMGRWRWASHKSRHNDNVLKQELKALQNHIIQGCGADFAKICIAQIDRVFQERGMKARLVLMIHDELIAMCPREEAYQVKQILEDVMTCDLNGVTLDVEAEIKYNLSKSSIDLSAPKIQKQIHITDDKGEKVYKDGSPVLEWSFVANEDYLDPATALNPVPVTSKPDVTADTTELLRPLRKSLDATHNKVAVFLQRKRRQREVMRG